MIFLGFIIIHRLTHYPIIALLRGSHSLGGRRAWRTKSSRPEGPKAGLKGQKIEIHCTCIHNIRVKKNGSLVRCFWSMTNKTLCWLCWISLHSGISEKIGDICSQSPQSTRHWAHSLWGFILKMCETNLVEGHHFERSIKKLWTLSVVSPASTDALIFCD